MRGGSGLRVIQLGLLLLGFTVLGFGCAQGSLSDRDSRLEQSRLQAEARRRELQLVAGEYAGSSVQPNGATHEIVLRLTIVDSPTVVEGQPEPILMPGLSGFARFYLGTNEYIVFAIDKAAFDVLNSRVELVAVHSEYKELLISLVRVESEMNGTWTAPSMSVSGTIHLTQVPLSSDGRGGE